MLDAIEVEINKACQDLIKETHPSSCVFGDILKLVSNPPKKDDWDPSKLCLVKKAECVVHKKKFFWLNHEPLVNFSGFHLHPAIVLTRRHG